MVGRKGIRRKILTNTLVAVVLLAIILFAVMMYFISTSTTSVLQETLEPLAKTSAQSLEGNLHDLADRILIAKGNEMLVDPRSTLNEKQAVFDRLQSGIEFVWFGLYDSKGKFLTGSEESPSDLSAANETFYNEMIQTQNLVISDTVDTGNGLSIFIGAPMFNSDGSIVEIMAGSYKYDVLSDALANINVGSGGSAFIMSHEGKIIAHKDQDMVSEQADIKSVLGNTETVDELFEQIALGQTNTVEFKNDSGDMFLSYAPVRGTNWSLVIITLKDDFTSASKQASAISIGVTLLLVLLAVIYSISISARIQQPLGRVTKRIMELADGDLHTDVKIEKTKDETESLSLALSETVKDVSSYTSELSEVLSQISNSNLDVAVKGEFRGDFVIMKESLNKIINFLNEMMDSIQQGSAQVLETSRLVANNAESVRQSSGSQSESIRKLNEETANIQDNIGAVKNNTEQVADLVGKVKNSIKQSRKDMQDTLDAMEDISSNSDEITDISKLLEDISFQTNILALNAAVEAVNAGFAGKGFAVVADEVRSLAEKSAESSKQTMAMIEQSKQSINEGSAYVNRLAGSLGTTLSMIEEIYQITVALTEAVATQTASLENIADQMHNINDLASSNLSASSTSAEASHELTQEADALREMAVKFRLRGEGGSADEDF